MGLSQGGYGERRKSREWREGTEERGRIGMEEEGEGAGGGEQEERVGGEGEIGGKSQELELGGQTQKKSCAFKKFRLARILAPLTH